MSDMSMSDSGAIIENWEPSYRLKPNESTRFVPSEVEKIIKQSMENHLLKASSFDDSQCKILALQLCSEIKEQVKRLNIPRYKVVLQSVIGEVKAQGAAISSRCLWDTEADNYATYSMKTPTVFCVIMVFGLYLE